MTFSRKLAAVVFLSFIGLPAATCRAQGVAPASAPSADLYGSSAAVSAKNSFKASITAEDLWSPLGAEVRVVCLRALLCAGGLLLLFVLGPMFWTLGALCGAAASYWGASSLAGGLELYSKMPDGGVLAGIYSACGAMALAAAFFTWLAMAVTLLPPLLNAANAASDRLAARLGLK